MSVKRIWINKKITLVSLLLLIVLIISGCSFVAHQFGRYAVLKDFCEKDAESTIYKEADVDGFFDGALAGRSTIDLLLDGKIKWVEICNKYGYPHSIVPTAGCWRLTRIKRINSTKNMQCNGFIDRHSIDYFYKGRKDFFTKSCLVAEPIKKQTAEYGLFFNQETVYTDKKNKFSIIKNEVLVKSNKDVAYRGINYILHHHNEVFADTASDCTDISDKYHEVQVGLVTAINNILRREYENK